jgi:hypothetical protein
MQKANVFAELHCVLVITSPDTAYWRELFLIVQAIFHKYVNISFTLKVSQKFKIWCPAVTDETLHKIVNKS